MFFNAQSTVSVISGRTQIDLITSQSFHSSRHFAVFVWGGFRENEVEWVFFSSHFIVLSVNFYSMGNSGRFPRGLID